MKSLALLVLLPSSAFAGTYADNLAKCLVEATTKDDRATLVRWVFVTVSANPTVSSVFWVPPADRDAANQAFGVLLNRLITETCKDRAKEALAHEGQRAIARGLGALSALAARELVSSAEVNQAMADPDKYLDLQKINDVLKSDPPD
jgi:hypothetical protein